MPALDVEDFHESDSSDNEENHSKLLSSVSQLDSTQRVKPAQRREIASEVSEHNLTQGTSSRRNLVDVKELAQVLGKKSGLIDIRKKLEKVSNKSETLPKPLEKPQEERLKRSLGFQKVKTQLHRWDAIVTRNALSDRLSFPLNDSSVKWEKSNDFLTHFQSKTPLEEEMGKVLKDEIVKEEEEDEDEKRFPLTLEEMLEKRKEMAQLRAKLHYKQIKAQRQNKIKSKKYHRFLKREKLRQELKEFEILQKTDPEAALKKLSELDKTRAQERATLRHRNTGLWARNLTVRAKYDVETRKVLADQLRMSRELTQKVSQLENSDDDDEEVEDGEENAAVTEPLDASSGDNPWALDVSKEVQNFMNGYRKFWSEQNEKKQEEEEEEEKKKKKKKKVEKESVENEGGKPLAGEETPKETPMETSVETPEREEKAKKRKETKSPVKGKRLRESCGKLKTFVSIQPTSGVWIVTPLEAEAKEEEDEEEEEEEPKEKKKLKADDIDTLFDELHEKLMKEAEKKAKTLSKRLKKKNSKREKGEKGDSDEEFDLSLKNQKGVRRPETEGGLLEGGDEEEAGVEAEKPPEKAMANGDGNKGLVSIDPKNFIEVKPKRLRTCLPDREAGNEDALDDEEEQQKLMEEAFGDDDVVAEFNEMKGKEEESSKVEIDTTLPGWGSWAGSGIKTERKKKLLKVNLPPRKDKGRKDLIINEKENPKVKEHLVKEVPHPFTSVDAFEAHIRAPVGREWVPETAHQKLIEKPVVTKLGTVIEPMNEDEIVRLKKASKSPYQGKKKTKRLLK